MLAAQRSHPPNARMFELMNQKLKTSGPVVAVQYRTKAGKQVGLLDTGRPTQVLRDQRQLQPAREPATISGSQVGRHAEADGGRFSLVPVAIIAGSLQHGVSRSSWSPASASRGRFVFQKGKVATGT